ncbi:MAG: DUF2848 domain-containing protein [SAR202 cluster bacterium]|nr:DUF2848 domain-containing protein [SAR202 cluster bacterium]
MLFDNKLVMKIIPLTKPPYFVDLDVKKIGCSRNSSRNIGVTKKYIDNIQNSGTKMHEPAGIAFKSRYLLTNESKIEVQGSQTSGEAEFVIFSENEKLYLSVGSDHNDRSVGLMWTEMLGKIEDTAKSKQMVPSVIAQDAWEFEEIKNHWDRIIVSSKITGPEGLVDYQNYSLSELLDITYYIDQEDWILQEGSVLLGGSGPLVDNLPNDIYKGQTDLGEFDFPIDFHFGIHDPVLNRTITHYYDVISIEPTNSFSL